MDRLRKKIIIILLLLLELCETLPGAQKELVTGLHLFIRDDDLSLLLTTVKVEKDLIVYRKSEQY